MPIFISAGTLEGTITRKNENFPKKIVIFFSKIELRQEIIGFSLFLPADYSDIKL
jgi:hypothetical protein